MANRNIVKDGLTLSHAASGSARRHYLRLTSCLTSSRSDSHGPQCCFNMLSVTTLTHTYTHRGVHRSSPTHTHTWTPTHTHTHTQTYTHGCLRELPHTHTYTHTYTHTNTHRSTLIHGCSQEHKHQTQQGTKTNAQKHIEAQKDMCT